MNKALLTEARDRLAAGAREFDHVLIAYSGGRDSSSILHMARDFWPIEQIHCYHYFTIPHLVRVYEEKVYDLPDKYGVPVHQIPARDLFDASDGALFVMPEAVVPDLCNFNFGDAARLARGRTGLEFIATGAKRDDGVGGTTGRAVLQRHNISGPVVFPLENWSQVDVLEYMAENDLTLHSQDEESSGLDLCAKPICHLYDCHREDYEEYVKMFPLAEAVIWHRHFYGAPRQRGGHTAFYVDDPKPPPPRTKLPPAVDWKRIRKLLMRDMLEYLNIILPEQRARERVFQRAHADSQFNPRNIP